MYRKVQQLYFIILGFLENESVLVLEVDETGYSSTLFVKEHTAHENIWEGTRSGVQGAHLYTGIEQTYNIKNLELHLHNSISVSFSNNT